MRNWFKNPGVRHLSSVLVSVLLSLTLANVMPPEAASAIGHAAGQAVGGA